MFIIHILIIYGYNHHFIYKHIVSCQMIPLLVLLCFVCDCILCLLVSTPMLPKHMSALFYHDTIPWKLKNSSNMITNLINLCTIFSSICVYFFHCLYFVIPRSRFNHMSCLLIFDQISFHYIFSTLYSMDLRIITIYKLTFRLRQGLVQGVLVILNLHLIYSYIVRTLFWLGMRFLGGWGW